MLRPEEGGVGSQPTRRQKPVSQFGKYMDALNTILGTTKAEVARIADIPKSTLSYASHLEEKRKATRETVIALVSVYEDLAILHGIRLPAEWSLGFRASATLREGEDGGLADVILKALEAQAGSDYFRRRVDELENHNRQLIADIAALKAEIQQLKQQRP